MLKYRAWDGKSKRYFQNGFTINPTGDIILNAYFWADKPDLIVEMSTGLKDKNGKEIFEGDIFKFGKHRAEVVFRDGGFGYFAIEQFVAFSGKNYIDKFLSELEVVGNIHQQIKVQDEELIEIIENALYSTGRFKTNECSDLTENLLYALDDEGYKLSKR